MQGVDDIILKQHLVAALELVEAYSEYPEYDVLAFHIRRAYELSQMVIDINSLRAMPDEDEY